MNHYIIPKIRSFSKYDELYKSSNTEEQLPSFFGTADNKYSNKEYDLEEIVKYIQRGVVVAEPGYGKSRLLIELFKLCSKHGMKSLIMELKKLDTEIPDFIQKKLRIQNYKYSFEVNGFEISKNFKFNNSEDVEDVFICLDALDEVESSGISKKIDWIIDFANKYQNVKLIVSCRTVSMKSKSMLFESAKFKFLSIEQISEENIKEYLKRNNIKEANIII